MTVSQIAYADASGYIVDVTLDADVTGQAMVPAVDEAGAAILDDHGQRTFVMTSMVLTYAGSYKAINLNSTGTVCVLAREWIAAGNTPSPYVATKDDLAAYASDLRWQKESGGITISGVPIATDDRSKLMITGARVAADADPAWTTIWQGTDGTSYPLNAAAMIAISNAVSAHVAGCFASYATVKAAIDAGTMTTTAAIDAAFA